MDAANGNSGAPHDQRNRIMPAKHSAMGNGHPRASINAQRPQPFALAMRKTIPCHKGDFGPVKRV